MNWGGTSIQSIIQLKRSISGVTAPLRDSEAGQREMSQCLYRLSLDIFRLAELLKSEVPLSIHCPSGIR